MPRETVTLVLDQRLGRAGQYVQLKKPEWDGSRPCLGIRPRRITQSEPWEELPACSSAQPGVRAAPRKLWSMDTNICAW